MPEAMPADQLMQSLIDVVSHEFFHILTPLSVHSEEIHYFDFNNPKMSQHLWLYEGVTEYFANLFQVQQGLIEEDEFYNRMAQKIMSSRRYDDKLPFTKMSVDVLSKPYKDNYLNVYEKGALIGMCLDIELRRVSQGKKGLIDLMQELSNKYGINKPFKDAELFDVITQLTHPDIRTFLDTHVGGPEPIDYEHFLAKVGVGFVEMEVPGNIFLEGNSPLISVNPNTKEIFWLNNVKLPEFYESIGIKGGDILLALDGVAYNLDNVYDMLMGSMSWQDGQDIAFKVKRDNETLDLKGKLILPKQKVEGLQQIIGTSDALRSAWLGN
jgi:predicted metalloprotease with PDZ domain